MPTSINLGKVRPTDKGEWSSTYEDGYDILDIVTSGKGSYMSKVELNTFELTDRTKWIPLVDSAAIELAIQEAMDAAAAADAARLAIEGELALKASHGYASDPKTLKEVDDSLAQLAGEVSELELKDVVQSDKIRDIENVISTMNPNQSAQLSVSGASPLSLPKNAANGGMSVKLEGLTAENIVVNGNFANGITGWTNLGSTLTHLDTAIRLEATSAEGRLFVQRSLPVGIYYVRMRARSIGDIAPSHIILGYLTTATQTIGQITNPVKDQWYDMSYVSSIGGGVTRFPQIVFNNGGAVIEIDKSIGITAINLGDAFGVGNEPTKEQCDAMFSDYFEGVKSFVPTGRVRSVDKNGLNPTALYLTAPELRSNGTVKDEIRKGANGYELVKRVGVGTLGAEVIANEADREFSSDTGWWSKAGNTVIANGVAKIISDGTANNQLYRPAALTTGKWYILEYEVISNTLVGGDTGNQIYTNGFVNGSANNFLNSAVGKHKYYAIGAVVTNINIRIYPGSTTSGYIEIDNISVVEINTVGAKTDSYAFTELSDGSVLYTLATPVISPINYGGILNSAENGTVYHEPIIADAGVYGTDIPIFNTDYPIASIEEIIKHEGGVDTYLNASTAVIAPDGLSFTHPDLGNGDLVLFTYAFDKESTNGNITATFYDSNVVKIDTVTGKAYIINEVVTNGVLTRTLTEV